jgi:hypothetical protein
VSDPADAELAIDDAEDVEVVDAVPVVAHVRDVQPSRSAVPVVAQAAAVAATGFAAGAVTAAVIRHHRVKKAVKRRRKDTTRLAEVVGSRSFLVDVHLLSPGSRD